MSDLEHGLTAYANGVCRCDVCRAAWALYSKLRRRRLLKSAKPLRGRARRARAQRSCYVAQQPFNVRLSGLGVQILVAAEQRSGTPLDEIVERIVREAGPSIDAAA